ncbi:MAG: glycoside hydrolase family 13 domain protein [Verrucomicrobia bacterium]|nr:glycoside hydrolase family 13 domain protein [Verrucomicrobiota bacterium]
MPSAARGARCGSAEPVERVVPNALLIPAARTIDAHHAFQLVRPVAWRMLHFRMPINPHRIVRAWLESLSSGVVELDRDWTDRTFPRFTLGEQCAAPGGLAPAPGLIAGRTHGYFLNPRGEISFVLPISGLHGMDPARDTVFLAGDFNGWQAAIGQPEWQLHPVELDGERVLMWTGDATRFLAEGGLRFKFVTGEHQWLVPPDDAPNVVRDDTGNLNRCLDPHRTGWHLWQFTLGAPLDLAEERAVTWSVASDRQEPVPLVPGRFFYNLKTDLPLGALVYADATVFRLFAPRAKSVTLRLNQKVGPLAEAQTFELARRAGGEGAAGVWEITLNQKLHGWFYWYTVDGVREGSGKFDPAMPVLDPYALAAVGRDGPGIILDRAWVGEGDRGFRTPAWHDLIIAEAHVRDLAANAPLKLTAAEKRGFTGLRKWVDSPEFYLHYLGVNCVELQPVQEFDNRASEEYHWGYMTNNYFAPESSFALAPAEASGVRELQELVRAFHRRGMAVVLDVVFNHVGEPAHLLFVDRLYYFEQDANGELANWSGCGNDIRARSAMAKRLIIDSCLHLIEAYGVDGFRFDLAELIGVPVLREIEAALKRVKPDVILIAEPWSFRGHIAGQLRDTGWSSWNDGYRDFVRDFVRGTGGADRMEYFLKGSPWFFAKWPAQTVNYTESHDDRAWLDMITENPGFDGFVPTGNDRCRTHLMAALLFMSLGIPMLAAGQDFLRSKHGVNNTYQRGDLNALDYRRLYRYLGTHAYFAGWIAFRKSERGRLLRQRSRPGEGFFEFFPAKDSTAFAAVYNADREQGPVRLLFTVNPTGADVTVTLPERVTTDTWHQLADQERFFPAGAPGATLPVEPELFVPALGCGLWSSEA